MRTVTPTEISSKRLKKQDIRQKDRIRLLRGMTTQVKLMYRERQERFEAPRFDPARTNGNTLDESWSRLRVSV